MKFLLLNFLFNNLNNNYVNRLPGICEPFNYFDPLKLSVNKDKDLIDFYHLAEIKHSRIAMLSIFGIISQEQIYNIPAIYQYNISNNYMITILLLSIGTIESYDLINNYVYQNKKLTLKKNLIRENFINLIYEKYFMYKQLDNKIELDKIKDIQTKELNHGRLSMILFIFIIYEEFTYQRTIYDFLFIKETFNGICI